MSWQPMETLPWQELADGVIIVSDGVKRAVVSVQTVEPWDDRLQAADLWDDLYWLADLTAMRDANGAVDPVCFRPTMWCRLPALPDKG